jgi:hypothetical protein
LGPARTSSLPTSRLPDLELLDRSRQMVVDDLIEP